METVFFGAERGLRLPEGTHRAADAGALERTHWDLLALSTSGCRGLERSGIFCGCGTLLLPGGQDFSILSRIRAECVISAGMSARDSLTFSSLGENGAVLCVQRTLPRPDGATVEPQELLLPPPLLPPEDALILLGMWLLLGDDVAKITDNGNQLLYPDCNKNALEGCAWFGTAGPF